MMYEQILAHDLDNFQKTVSFVSILFGKSNCLRLKTNMFPGELNTFCSHNRILYMVFYM